MPSHFTVVQYVPDPVREERVNVGVIVMADGEIHSKFVRNWSRVRLLGGEDLSFLRNFAKQVGGSTSPQLALPGVGSLTLTPEDIRQMSSRWLNSIQLTEPRASLLSADELLQDVARRYLIERPSPRHSYRDRRKAAQLAFQSLDRAVKQQEREVSVERNQRVKGELDEHVFDVTLTNGHLALAAHGLSFEGPHRVDLTREVDATKWAVDDVRKAASDIPIAIIALPPKKGSKAFSEATRVFEDLGATVVVEDEVFDWAETQAGELDFAESPA